MPKTFPSTCDRPHQARAADNRSARQSWSLWRAAVRGRKEREMRKDDDDDDDDDDDSKKLIIEDEQDENKQLN